MRDVAAAAGVATGTVSNVLNRPEKVSAETIARVEEAMRQLGWTRHQVAQQLRGGRSTAIGLVVAELNPHTVRLIDTIERELDTSGYTLQVATSARDSYRELQRVDLFAQQRVRGILLSPVADHENHMHRFHQLHIPIVLLGRRSSRADVCSVAGDDVTGGGLVIAHLNAQGHRHIAIVGGSTTNPHVRARIEGAQSAATPTTQLTVVPTDHYDSQAGEAAAQQILDHPRSDRPTAVFAINDLLAIGLQCGLQSAGLRIPTDLSVVGYDDIPLARSAPVALTTIANPDDDVARSATLLLLDDIAAERDDNHVHHRLQLPPHLVLRNSTARLVGA